MTKILSHSTGNDTIESTLSVAAMLVECDQRKSLGGIANGSLNVFGGKLALFFVHSLGFISLCSRQTKV
jgi:hypothetical protein